ncbi:7TM diverse intracellular signaling domain-containing protein [Marinomonas algarum]|uniref:7TM diverse intracellular signalling n=1 Tax=Marinomonas algarum TaxID=2883105 RepID=A0A9X1LCB5_9GAMM|nr:7TM diverse intracellular signaling domain-containing protein [Marinomonas algarum]MCB5161322.1 hypothetical protein [Marinomonas algarum]
MDDTHDAINIGQNGDYFIDETGTLTLKDVMSDAYSKQFRPLNKEYLQFGFVKGNIWMRNDIAIRTTSNTPSLLEINSHRLQYLDIYLPSLYDNQVQAELGSARPYSNRLVKASNYIFPIPANTPPVFTLYVKLSSSLPINTQIELKTLSTWSQDTQSNLTLTGILIGVLLTLFIFNVFFFIRTAHPMYLMYGTLLVGIVILHLSIHDQVAQFFPSYRHVQERIYNLAALLCLCAIVFFSRLYLDNRTYLPKLDKVLLAISSINALFAVVFMIAPEKIHIMTLSLMMIATLIILMIHAIVAFNYKVPFSGYYLTARLTLCIGYFAWILSVYGIAPSLLLLQWGLTVTIIIEAMIHFTGMIAQTSSLLQRSTRDMAYPDTVETELLSDVSARLRRQNNIIHGALSHFEKMTVTQEGKNILEDSLVANNNIQDLVKRIDLINTIKEDIGPKQTHPELLDHIIDKAYNNAQRLDQNSAVIELHTQQTDHIEILQHTRVLQSLIEGLIQECKHFTDQTLTLNITRREVNREGITQLELSVFPLPSHVGLANSSVDMGVYYLTQLIHHMKGEIQIYNQNKARNINVTLPIRARIRPSEKDITTHTLFDLVLFGQEDHDLQKALGLLQSRTNKIEHFTTLEGLLDHFEVPTKRTTGTITLIFDNGGHIPHITQQKLLPLMRHEDQCLLITDNVKMSLDYAKKLGFDELLYCADLDNQLNQQLNRLIQKAERLVQKDKQLKKTNLSSINPTTNTP